MNAPAQHPHRQPAVVAIVTSADEAGQALDGGADALDPQGPGAVEAVAARWPESLWRGGPQPVDCDEGALSEAAIVAVAAVCAWRAVPAVRTRQVRAVRRAVDMVAAIRGDRPPHSAVRGLA